jgi:hypothetical protein
MLQAGEPIQYVQRQLGHRTISMTVDLYGRWLPAGNPAAADRLAARIDAVDVSDLSATRAETRGSMHSGAARGTA